MAPSPPPDLPKSPKKASSYRKSNPPPHATSGSPVKSHRKGESRRARSFDLESRTRSPPTTTTATGSVIYNRHGSETALPSKRKSSVPSSPQHARRRGSSQGASPRRVPNRRTTEPAMASTSELAAFASMDLDDPESIGGSAQSALVGQTLLESSESDRSGQDTIDDSLTGGGFSPHALLDRYTAEIDLTTRQKEEEAAAKAASAPPALPQTSLVAGPSLFWKASLGSDRGNSERSLHSPPPPPKTPIATSSTTSAPGMGAADLDLSDHYGRPAHLRRKGQQGGAFSQKERFEHVDQSVNLMDMRHSGGDNSPVAGTADALTTRAERRRKRFQTTSTGRFGASLSDHDAKATLSPVSKPRQSVFRTISKGLGLSDVFLGDDSFRGGLRKHDLDASNSRIDEEDEEEEGTEPISLVACCQCLCFSALLVIVVMFMAGVIPLPEEWGMPQTSATERSGEGMDSSTSSSWDDEPTKPPPKRLHSPPPTPAEASNITEKRWEELHAIISANRLSSPEDLEDPESSAYQALEWLSKENRARVSERVVDADSSTDIQNEVLERYALAVLYFATQGNPSSQTIVMERNGEVDATLLAALRSNPEVLEGDLSLESALDHSGISINKGGWHHSTGWMTETHVCQWYGIQCHRDGRVSSIHLQHNQLHGQIPSELRTLEQLQHLDLSYNHLREQVPDVLWASAAAWTTLVTLDLSSNRLMGSLPAGISGLGNLQNLTLANNRLTGEVPTAIADLTSLKVFSVQNNRLTGSIRDTSPIPDLRILRLGQNQFEGEFPFHLTRNRNLMELRLDQNQLEGTLPPELDSLHQLEWLQVDSNQFQGPLPDVFGRLHRLELLDIQNNLFGQYHDREEKPAKLPKSLGALTNLKTLKLNTNRFRGDIPEEWWNMKSLETCHLHDNDFQGSIPSDVNSFSMLRDFQVQDSFMSGTIPTQLGECQHLETLTLYNSKFTGWIPNEICDLRHLTSGISRSSEELLRPKLKLLAADCTSALQCDCCDRCY